MEKVKSKFQEITLKWKAQKCIVYKNNRSFLSFDFCIFN